MRVILTASFPTRYVSGLDYYRGINEQYIALMGKGHLMPPNPNVLMASVDCDA